MLTTGPGFIVEHPPTNPTLTIAAISSQLPEAVNEFMKMFVCGVELSSVIVQSGHTETLKGLEHLYYPL